MYLKIIFVIVLVPSSIVFASISREFNRVNIPLSFWKVQRSFPHISYEGTCSTLCLMDLSACKAFSVDFGYCEFGNYDYFLQFDNSNAGRRVYIMNKANSVGGDEADQTILPQVKVPHIAFFGAINGQQDYSFNDTAFPPMTLPAPHSDIATFRTSQYNFFDEASGKFYMCGVMTWSTNQFNKNCYSWILGDPAGFVLEAGQAMSNNHYQGSGIDLGGGKFWVTGGTSTAGTTQTNSTEYWQNGKWTKGPDLPIAAAQHAVAKISPKQAIFISGWTISGYCVNGVWIVDFTTGMWTRKSNYPGSDLCAISAGMIKQPDGKSYVLKAGGHFATSFGTNTAHLYDIALDAWTTLPNLPATRESATALVLNNQFMLWGGYDNYNSMVMYHDVWLFVPQNNTFVVMATLANTAGLLTRAVPYNY